MFGWLQKKFTTTQLNEVESFLRSLRGAEQGVIDLVCGAQMYWAAFYAAPQRAKDLYFMENWILEQSFFPVELGSNIRALQKQGTTSSVPGLMVWLHSSRALLTPELRLSGRMLWAELVKASGEAEQLAYEMCGVGGYDPLPFDRTRVPFGLEPLAR